MKTTTPPSSRTPPNLRQPNDEIPQKFIARALYSRDDAYLSQKYVSADAVIGRLEQMLLNRKCRSPMAFSSEAR